MCVCVYVNFNYTDSNHVKIIAFFSYCVGTGSKMHSMVVIA